MTVLLVLKTIALYDYSDAVPLTVMDTPADLKVRREVPTPEQ